MIYSLVEKVGRFDLSTCHDCWCGRWHAVAADRCGNQRLVCWWWWWVTGKEDWGCKEIRFTYDFYKWVVVVEN